MDEALGNELTAATTADNTGPPIDLVSRDAAIKAIHTRVETLMAVIQERADTATAKNSEIEQGRQLAEKSRSEIDGHLATIKEAITNLQVQLDSARLVVVELTNLQGSATSTNNQTLEVKAQAAVALQSLQGMLASATENANRIEVIKAGAEQTQGVIATKSEHIEGGRLHTDEVRGKIDRLLTEAQQSATNAEAQHQVSRTAMDNLNNLYATAQTVKATVDSDAATVANLRQHCEEHAATAKKLADIADMTAERVKAYEARLAELEQTAASRLTTIEGLLPGAASAGLASAFNQRRVHFKWPQIIWQVVFVASLVALLGIAVFEFSPFSNPDTALTWERLSVSLLHRLPFALPLIWLAFHASHKSALAQRVEEDYAFKETVSRSFEGYRREMAELEGKAAPQSALSHLCAGVLSVITNPPGRIYEKHQLNRTPMNALAKSAAPIVDAASKTKLI